MTLRISPVLTWRDRARFAGFPFGLYRNDPCWVPPLRRDEKRGLSPAHNPFFERGDVCAFLAVSNGRTVGRIVAIENRSHNERFSDRVGFFGGFECVDDGDVAGALFASVSDWLRARGLTALRGPTTFTMNEVCGLFVDGRPGRPYFMMPYNKPYYPSLLEASGFQKVKDLHAYCLDDTVVPDRLERLSERLASRSGVRVRGVSMRDFDAEVGRLFDLYNECWQDQWGFVPMTEREIRLAASQLRPFVDPDLVCFLERISDGKPLGVALAFPDINEAIARARGRLWPLGWLRILRHRRRIRRLRMPLMGLLKDIRGKGLDTLMYLWVYRNGVRKGYVEAELSWVIEDNVKTRNAIEKAGGRMYRTYRMYEREI